MNDSKEILSVLGWVIVAIFTIAAGLSSGWLLGLVIDWMFSK